MATPGQVAAEARLQTILAARSEDQQCVLADLRHVGVEVHDVLDLKPARSVSKGREAVLRLKASLPILLGHIVSLAHSDGLTADIIRIFSTKEGSRYWGELLALFEDPRTHDLPCTRQALASTIAHLAKFHPDGTQIIQHMLRDPAVGRVRILLLMALGESKNPAISALVKEFVADPVLAVQANWYLEHPGRKSR